MTGRQSLFRSFFDMNGTASRKRGWLVFGATFFGLTAVTLLPEAMPDLQRWLLPLLGPIMAVGAIAVVQRLHDAGRSGYWALLVTVPFLGLVAIVVINSLRPRPGLYTPPGDVWAQRLGYLALCGFAALALSRGFVGLYWIPSGSMKPTFLVGDYMLVPFVSPEDVQHGDLLVFRHPVNGSDFIKRLIGLPGDTVQLKGGKLWLNGAEVPQADTGTFTETYGRHGPDGHVPRCQNEPLKSGEACIKAMALETLPGGPSYAVLNIVTDAPVDNTQEFTVPVGHFFFLGDNRDNSIDSRFEQAMGGVGFVPMENLIGRVSRIVFSAAGNAFWDVSMWRAGRYWKVVE